MKISDLKQLNEGYHRLETLNEYREYIIDSIKNGRYGYRGMKHKGDILVMSPLKDRTHRFSPNYVNLIISSGVISEWRNHALRAQSIFMTPNESGAISYGNHTYLAIPLELNKKVSYTLGGIWGIRKRMFVDVFNEELESVLEYFGFNAARAQQDIRYLLDSLEELSEMKASIKDFNDLSSMSEIDRFLMSLVDNGVQATLEEFFAPDNTESMPVKNFDSRSLNTNAIWTESNCLLISENIDSKIRSMDIGDDMLKTIIQQRF